MQQTQSIYSVLSDELVTFSRDIVKMVHRYLVFPTATANAKPRPQMTIESKTRYGCTGIATSPDNEIWASGSELVQMFSREGKFLHHVAKGQWKDACGIAFAVNGEAYIADQYAHCIVVCRPDGRCLRRIGSRGRRDGQFTHPIYVAIDSKQELLFVIDFYHIQVLKLDGSFVRAFGSFGNGEGQFCLLRGIALSSAGEVAVADGGNHRVQVFDCNGKFLRKFGSGGSANGHLNYPMGLAVDSADNWIVCDQFNHRVQVFAADGGFITAFHVESPPYCVEIDFYGRLIIGCADKTIRVLAFE